MTVAYVDTSALVAIAFGEPGSAALGRRLGTFSVLLSSNLLEAELRAAYSREERRFSQAVVSGIEWILPDRPLASEFAKEARFGGELLDRARQEPGRGAGRHPESNATG